MQVSSTTSYAPAMKAGLYFAEPCVLFNRAANYVNPEGQKISPEGVRYFEDTKVPAEIKDRIQAVPLVKKLAEDHDVFVNYISQNYSYSKQNITRIYVMYADYSKTMATKYAVEGIAEEAQTAIDIAFGKLCNLRANRALTGELNFFEKLVDKVKKIRF